MSLAFHEDEVCEAIVQYLERRERATRYEVMFPDKDPDTSRDMRVEMTFKLNGSQYAIEHTGIEPFDGFLEHQNRAPDLFHPIENAATRVVKSLGISAPISR